MLEISNPQNKPKIFVFIGPPGSGKTTTANAILKNYTGIVRISKDLIRDQLRNTRANEDDVSIEPLVGSIYDASIEKAIDRGFSVLLDTTNCDFKTLEKRLDYYLSITNQVELFPMKLLTIDELIMRNVGRPIREQLPLFVIKSMRDKFQNTLNKLDILNEKIKAASDPLVKEPYDSNLKDCVIIDMDDTLCRNTTNRHPYEWHRVEEDEPIKEMVTMINSLDEHIVRIYLTGRSESCKEHTKRWLGKYMDLTTINPDYSCVLLMRGERDFRSAPETKGELYEKFIRGKYNVLAVFDDDARAVEMYRRKGLNTLLRKRN